MVVATRTPLLVSFLFRIFLLPPRFGVRGTIAFALKSWGGGSEYGATPCDATARNSFLSGERPGRFLGHSSAVRLHPSKKMRSNSKLGTGFVQPPTPVHISAPHAAAPTLAEDDLYVGSRLDTVQLSSSVIGPWRAAVAQFERRDLARRGAAGAEKGADGRTAGGGDDARNHFRRIRLSADDDAAALLPQSRARVVDTVVAAGDQALRSSHLVLGDSTYTYRDADAGGTLVFQPRSLKLSGDAAASSSNHLSSEAALLAKGTHDIAAVYRHHRASSRDEVATENPCIVRRDQLSPTDRVAFDQLLKLWRQGSQQQRRASAEGTAGMQRHAGLKRGRRDVESSDMSQLPSGGRPTNRRRLGDASHATTAAGDEGGGLAAADVDDVAEAIRMAEATLKRLMAM